MIGGNKHKHVMYHYTARDTVYMYVLGNALLTPLITFL